MHLLIFSYLLFLKKYIKVIFMLLNLYKHYNLILI